MWHTFVVGQREDLHKNPYCHSTPVLIMLITVCSNDMYQPSVLSSNVITFPSLFSGLIQFRLSDRPLFNIGLCLPVYDIKQLNK